jgi:hypothetical protein
VPLPIAFSRLVKEPESPTGNAFRRHWPNCRRAAGENLRSALRGRGTGPSIAPKSTQLAAIRSLETEPLR